VSDPETATVVDEPAAGRQPELRKELYAFVDRKARLALANGRRGTRATLARARGVSPQAVSKRHA
jgi:hypothetical protein